MTGNVVEIPEYRDIDSIFRDRLEAGERLGAKLKSLLGPERTHVLSIPAGGVPVGYAVSKKLGVPFDIIVVRKIQIPWDTEAGFGAMSWDGTVVLNEPLVAHLALTSQEIEECLSQTRRTVNERLKRFCGGEHPCLDLAGRAAILVDDGLASGFTMLAAVRSVKNHHPARLIVAAPTASLGAVHLLAPQVDLLVSLNIRCGPIFAVADAYRRWHDLSDEEVEEYLNRARSEGGASSQER